MRILAALGGNFKSSCEVNQKFQRFLLFFSTPHHTKGNQAAGQNRARIGAYCVVQTLYLRFDYTGVWPHSGFEIRPTLIALVILVECARIIVYRSQKKKKKKKKYPRPPHTPHQEWTLPVSRQVTQEIAIFFFSQRRWPRFPRGIFAEMKMRNSFQFAI